ncbi:pentatricopeptide repeat-containing protein At4g15720 [Durio zibethinus]|uniref:Pentatricopeptide repeat-containing protein At4g15720 n=1 Tax=Durio zibethinus TaxID=66656 RepID=A0A6P6A720_DURZI|nr:pentatricopeptide repeat-containing protein At4g15720 [Durio zibethinus]
MNSLPFTFRTKIYFIKTLQNCNDLVFATLTHAKILKSGFLNDTFTTNYLINCYIRLQKTAPAFQLFDEMPEPNVVSYSSLMSGYINVGKPQICLWLFREMQKGTVLPNEFTFATAIKACSILANLKGGKQIHGHVEIFGYQFNLVVCSSLVDMYGKCNEVDLARRVFDSMEGKNVVSWTSMITAYAQSGRGHEALEVFREFNWLVREHANQFILASVINACASLGKLISGKVAHGAVIRCGHHLDDVVASALVDMYAKCGCIVYSDRVFRRVSNPCVIPYTSMIVAAGKHGLGKLSIELFEEMIDRGIRPNNVTFLAVLHACSHSGLVDESLEYLNSMSRKHGMEPDAKHYTCVVDMLGRTGHLDEAYQLAKSIKVNNDEGAVLWGTLLSASRLHGRVEIAVEASKRVIESNQQVASAYVTLSNTYVLAGEWENAHSLRTKMKQNGVCKEPGCSWVEIKDSTYVFYAGDVSFERGSEVLSMLRELERKMKERGYKGRTTGLVFVDVEEEAMEEIVGLHSEKLALAFGLISIPNGVTIRIMKNLRMCRDCHEAFKWISEITERDIVVRDVNRFHHFDKGLCTCRDFW